MGNLIALSMQVDSHPMFPSSWIGIVSQVLFPIIVCGYLLWERRTAYQQMRTSFHKLTSAVQTLVMELHFQRTGKVIPPERFEAETEDDIRRRMDR